MNNRNFPRLDELALQAFLRSRHELHAAIRPDQALILDQYEFQFDFKSLLTYIENNDLAEARELLDRKPNLLLVRHTVADESGYKNTPLQLAYLKGHLQMYVMLIGYFDNRELLKEKALNQLDEISIERQPSQEMVKLRESLRHELIESCSWFIP